MKILLACIIGLFSMSVSAVNIISEDFNSGIPGTWTVIDNEGSGLVWGDLAACLGLANYTGGTGDAACVNSDDFGPAEFDTELLTPSMDLTLYTNTMLDLTANYQNLANDDFFDIDVSIDGGISWTNELSWNEDHGGFKALPGEAISLDLSAYDGQADVTVRFHWYDPNTGDWDWYIQIDDVVISATEDVAPPVAVAIPVPSLTFWSLMLLMLSVVGSALLLNRKQS